MSHEWQGGPVGRHRQLNRKGRQLLHQKRKPSPHRRLATGEPNELRDFHSNFVVRNFLQRGEAEEQVA